MTGAVRIVGNAAEARRRLAGRNRVTLLQAYSLLHMGANEFNVCDAGTRVRWDREDLPSDLMVGYTSEARRATRDALLLLGYSLLWSDPVIVYGRADVWEEDLDRLCRGLSPAAEASVH